MCSPAAATAMGSRLVIVVGNFGALTEPVRRVRESVPNISSSWGSPAYSF
jgi:hypothetical protein